jgi:hypothetical protein
MVVGSTKRRAAREANSNSSELDSRTHWLQGAILSVSAPLERALARFGAALAAKDGIEKPAG